MLAFFNYIGEANIDVLEMASPYTALLIIKHFTSLEVPDDVDNALELLNVLIDLDALGKIVNALPEAEVIKMYELIAETIDNINENMVEAERTSKELSDSVENKEILAVQEDSVVEESTVEADTDAQDS